MRTLLQRRTGILLGVFCLILLAPAVALANACESQGSGNWNTAGTWANCGGTTPGVADSVTILNTHNVTIDTTISVASITIQNGGTLTQDNTNTQAVSGSLTIDSGGILTHSQNTDTSAPWLENADINFQVASLVLNGTITADGLGYPGATVANTTGSGPNPGTGSGDGGAGGGHGGDGGNGSDGVNTGGTGGTGNDLLVTPSDSGSGGGACASGATSAGGDGGGSIQIEVTGAGDSFALDGVVTADGAAGLQNGGSDGGGGGAGGSVYINMSGGGNITGSGSITVTGGNGGDSSADDGGGGGGGRIAIVGYGSLAGTVTYSVYGGTSGVGYEGGSGTLVTKASGADGTLILDNNGMTDYTKSTMASAEGTVTFDNIKIQNGGHYVIPSGERINLDASSLTTPTANTNSTVGKLRVEGSFYVNSAADVFTVPKNNYLVLKAAATFQSNDGSSTNVDLTLTTDGDAYGSGDEDGTLVFSDFTNASTAFAFGAMTVNGKVTHEQNDTGNTLTDKIKMSATSIDLSATGIIDVDALGYRGATSALGNGSGPNPGTGEANGGGGGAHGGDGGAGHDGGLAGGSGGAGNGLLVTPTDSGSGGGACATATTSAGGNGGGNIQIEVSGAGDSFTLEGAITADGAAGLQTGSDGGGGGAGGSVYINMSGGGNITGSGSITVTGGNGGDSSADDGGGGGGGRIAIVGYGSLAGTVTYSVYGGTSGVGYEGGSGTLVTKASGADGTLILDNNGMTDYTKSTMASAEGTVTFDNIKVQNGGHYVIPSGERINLDASSLTTPTANTNSTVGKLRVEGSFYVNSAADVFTVPKNNYLVLKAAATFQSNDGSSTNVDLTLTTDGDAYGSGDEDGTLVFSDFTNASTAFAFGAMTVNGKVTHEQNDTGSTLTDKIKLSATSIDLSATGIIDVDALGYRGATSSVSNGSGPNPGVGSGDGGGGGGHGGDGGSGGDASLTGGSGGAGNGLLVTPTDSGSGGGSCATATTSAGGNGGGNIQIEVSGAGDSFAVEGAITADGAAGLQAGSDGGGGGAGGSVYINMSGGGNITGSGSITVTGGNGGDSTADDGGGGGGGRIAIVGYGTLAGTVTYGLNGGTSAAGVEGGSGTLVTKASGADGTLILDNNGMTDYAKSTMASAEGTVTFDNIKIQNGGHYVIPSGERINLDASSFTAPGTGDGKLRVEGSFYVNSGGDSFTITENVYLIIKAAATFQSNDGSPADVNLTVAADGADGDSTPGVLEMSDFTNVSSAFAFGTITLNGKMTHEQNSTGNSLTDKIKISTPSLTVSSTGVINVDGLGYRGGVLSVSNGSGPGPGIGDGNGGGGGGHAGSGGQGHDGGLAGGAGGSSYDTATAPTDHGSGGGACAIATTSAGGNGGGAIEVSIIDGGTFTLEGIITADGSDGLAVLSDGGGGGGGGSVYVNFDAGGTFTGDNGTITATGGAGGDSTGDDGGGGSAGLIAIIGFTSNTTSGLTTTVTGGSGPGAATDGASGTYTANAGGSRRVIIVSQDESRDSPYSQI